MLQMSSVTSLLPAHTAMLPNGLFHLGEGTDSRRVHPVILVAVQVICVAGTRLARDRADALIWLQLAW